MTRSSLSPRLFALVAITLGSIALAAFPRWTVDDAFIILRYADNWAHAGHYTYNLGEPPVEGCTGILLPAILALGIRLGVDGVELGRAVGLASWGVAAFALWRLLARLRVGDGARAVTIALYAVAPFLYVHAWAGLETMLFGALVVAGLWALARAAGGLVENRDNIPQKYHGYVILSLVLLAASLARPDGVALAGACFVALAWVRDRAGRVQLARAFGLAYVLPGAAYFAWRVWYFGALLPNPFYRKVGEWHAGHVVESLGGLGLTYLWIPALGVGFVWLVARVSVSSNQYPVTSNLHGRTRRPVLIAAFLFALASFALYLRADPIMDYAYRYAVPLYVVALVALAPLIDGTSSRLAALRLAAPTRFRLAAALLVVLAPFHLAWGAFDGWKLGTWAREYANGAPQALETAAIVRDVVPEGESFAVVVDAGKVPYYAGRTVIDCGGLTDAYIARHHLDNQACADYVYARNPAALVITSWDWNRLTPMHDPGYAIGTDPRFAGYRLAGKTRTIPTEGLGWTSYYFVYVREDLARDVAGL